MVDSAPLIVRRTADTPEPVGGTKVVQCQKCGEDCWLSRVTQLRVERGGMPYEIFCTVCLDLHPSDPRYEIRAVVPAIPRSQQFFPPRGHTAVTCTLCNQLAWADVIDVTYAAECRVDLHYYCTNCCE